MKYWVYILQSETTSKRYVGHTSDLERRLSEHNDPTLGKRRYTRNQEGSWKLIHVDEHETRSEAMKREKFLKSGTGRRWALSSIDTN